MYLFHNSIHQVSEDFVKLVDSIVNTNPLVADFLIELDAKSSATYKHSVSVALQFYAQAKSDGILSDQELTNWTIGALLHDVGKLSVPNYILHGGDLSDSEFAEMMGHSILGERFLSKKNMPKEVIAASIGHHLSSSSTHNGMENASKSRSTWKKSFGEEYVQNLIEKNIGWVSYDEHALYALSALSVVDCTEALRCSYRSYHASYAWGNEEQPGSIRSIIAGDVARGIFDEDAAKMVRSREFQTTFDALQSIGMEQKIRELLAEKHFEHVPVYTQDKIRDIENAPETGILFFEKAKEKENGREVFVICPKQLNDREPVTTDCLVIPALQNGKPDLFAFVEKVEQFQFAKNFEMLESPKVPISQLPKLQDYDMDMEYETL